MMEVSPFGVTSDGRQVDQITLDNGILRCCILTYGATLTNLFVPGRDGQPVDVVLGFDQVQTYQEQDKYLGAVVGRYANRIAKGRFTLNGQEYTLACNNGENHLHGGPTGFSTQIWQAQPCENGVTFTYESQDMEEGFPGRLTAQVTYQLVGRELRLHYQAASDRDTVCNLTNHAYFNLSGHDAGGAMDQILTLHAQSYTPVIPGSIPTGEIAPVEGTPMDFRTPTPIGVRIDADFEQLQLCGGYDHNWVVDGPVGQLRPTARLESPVSGISMEVETTLPGVQFYAGNYLDGCPTGKGGARYGKRDGVCLETQFFPDSPNHPQFPQCVLRPGQVWDHTTVFRF